MGQYFRLVAIGLTVLRFGLDEVALSGFRQGWVRVGVVPGYALLPQGGLCHTTFYYRDLGG